MTNAAETTSEIYGDYAAVLGAHTAWKIGSFPLAGGRIFQMREPEAVMLVRGGYMSIGVPQLTRFHDRSQILDNAKHVMFSTRAFRLPDDGAITFEVAMRVRRRGAVPGDLYDGYGSFLCLDLGTGTAMDIFLAEDLCAAVFARLPFPGLDLNDNQPFKYWAIFSETELDPRPEGFHDFRLEIDARKGVTWWADGQQIGAQPLAYRLGELTLGLAIMTEKDLRPSGSVSLHGQGVQGEWSPITVTTRGEPQ